MNWYEQIIADATGCSPALIPEIEDLMRIEKPTFDDLTVQQLRALAQRAAVALDPTLRAEYADRCADD
jgi:hypothetical protein